MRDYTLADRYRLDDAAVYLTGLQALIRAVFDHQREQLANGSRYGAFISGYPGSPLAGLDKELHSLQAVCDELAVVFQPAVNEEIAATSVAGSQLAAQRHDATFDGVIGLWFGKAPGIERAHDAMKHGNFIGAAPNGGVLIAVGDDPACTSSTVPSASEGTLAEVFMPVLYPGSAQDVLDLAFKGYELSRRSGLWVGLKMVAAVAESAADVVGGINRFSLPPMPASATNRRLTGFLLPPSSIEIEREIMQVRLPAAVQAARDLGLNPVRAATDERGRVGVVAAGRQWFDVLQAFHDLGFDDDSAVAELGIRLWKLDMISPLDRTDIRRFAAGLSDVYVIEEKRGFIERQVVEALYELPDRPRILGKLDESGRPLFGDFGVVTVDDIAAVIARWITGNGGVLPDSGRAHLSVLEQQRRRHLIPIDVQREPWFCSGCPHNTSTVVPDGTLVGGGIGCHSMVMWMDHDRIGEVIGLTQMGGEGANWIGMSPFVATSHLVQNLGDGTFFHSGHLAIRAAIAAGSNITYKILFNSAVAMTGGQDPTGGMEIGDLVRLLRAEGVPKIIITSDDTSRYRSLDLPHDVDIRDRAEMITVQNELAATGGVTVLIHDQQCAAEKRRLRKRGGLPEPKHKIVINERVCEGCGDCMNESNCLSLETIDTDYGPKTRINETTCNLDESCVRGDCPSFVTVIPPARKKKISMPTVELPRPTVVVDAERCEIRIVGVGGTGVVTLNQLLGTAAMLDGLHATGLDQTGLSQKGGMVVSDLTISRTETASGVRIGSGAAEVLLACDPIAAVSARALDAARPDHTIAVVSTATSTTGRMLSDHSLRAPSPQAILTSLGAVTRSDLLVAFDAAHVAETHCGSQLGANVVVLGAAFQAGLIPVSAGAIERAISLNGAAVESNLAAFAWGRATYLSLAGSGSLVSEAAELPDDSGGPVTPAAAFAAELVRYQSSRYSTRFTSKVDAVAAVDVELAEVVARNLFKLMAYKDEYEVARLLTDPAYRLLIEAEFGPGSKVRYHIHPPLLRVVGVKGKIELGGWFSPVLKTLRWMKFLRGTPFDVFGYAKVRRTERALVGEYETVVERLLVAVRSGAPRDKVLAIAELPQHLRGYESIKMASVDRYRSAISAQLAALESTAPEMVGGFR